MKIAIASGKGGTGKTLVSTNLFRAAQEKKIPITLVDCDAEEPNVREFIQGEKTQTTPIVHNIPFIDPEACMFCGKCQEYCNYNAIVLIAAANFIKVMDDLCRACGACSVACQYGAITTAPQPIGACTLFDCGNSSQVLEARADVGLYSPVPIIRKALSMIEDESLALLDSPPGISCPFLATVETADFVVLVTEPTPFGLNDLKLSAETLQTKNVPFGVIINRAGLGNRDVYAWLIENNIPLLAEIPFDKAIAKIYSTGDLIYNELPEYKTLFEHLLDTIIEKATR